jgi:polyisoprenoid-binding protein YceI
MTARRTLSRVSAVIVSFALACVAHADPASQDPAKAPAGAYALDNRHASLIVKVPHMGGFSRYTMRFTKLDGGFTYDPADWAATKVTITVDPKSLDSEDTSFNKQIVSWFEPEKYPAITFASTGIQAEGPRGTVTGDLTFHGVTRPVTLDVVFNGSGPGLLGAGTRMGFSGTGRIKRSDFGVTNARQWAGDDIDLIFEVEFVKKQAAAP